MKNTKRIKVVGLGGDGALYISHILEYNLEGVDFIHIDTDSSALRKSAAPIKLLIGAKVTRGLGCDDPEVNKRVAEESFHEICEVLQGADIVILMYRLSSAISSGTGPIIAKAAQSVGAVTLGIVTSFWGFEGTYDSRQAYNGLNALRNSAGTFIIFPVYKFKGHLEGDNSYSRIIESTLDILRNIVNAFTSINISGDDSNIEYSDLKSLLSNGGFASVGLGRYDYQYASGLAVVHNAARVAMFSPCLEIPLYRARAVISILSSSVEVSKEEINFVKDLTTQIKGSPSKILCGSAITKQMEENSIRVMFIAF